MHPASILVRTGNRGRSTGEEPPVRTAPFPVAQPNEEDGGRESAGGSQHHETANRRNPDPEYEHDAENEDEPGGALDRNLLDPDPGMWFWRPVG